jgi:hypothetical protein
MLYLAVVAPHCLEVSADQEIFGFDLPKKQRLLPQSTLDDIVEMEKITALERSLLTRDSILCVNSTKNFTAIERQAYKHFVDPLNAKKIKKKHHQKTTQKVTMKPKGKPIILVPAAVQSVIGLYNIEEFLINQRYVIPNTTDLFLVTNIVKKVHLKHQW